MYDILCKLDTLPIEIVNSLFPYVPFAGMTKEIIELQRRRMKLYKCIRRYLYIDDNTLRRDIFNNFNGGDEYVFENDEYFVFIRICFLKESLEDYFALSF